MTLLLNPEHSFIRTDGLNTQTFEGGYDVHVSSSTKAPFLSHCHFTLVSKNNPQDIAVFLHVFDKSMATEVEKRHDVAEGNIKRIKSTLSFYHSLTNDQCKQAIKEYQKKN